MAPFWSKDGFKGLPAQVYAYLITRMNETHEHAERLKLLQHRDIDAKGKQSKIVKIRVVEPQTIPKNIKVERYADLDNHPELILYEGYYSKDDATDLSLKKPSS